MRRTAAIREDWQLVLFKSLLTVRPQSLRCAVEVATESLPPQISGDWVVTFGTFSGSFVNTSSLKSIHLELNLQANAGSVSFTERVMFT